MLKPNFKKAQRKKQKASIMIEGLTGKGKSGLALLLGYYLADEHWNKVFAIDTENKSLDLFSNIPFSNDSTVGDFMVAQLTKDVGYKPSNYLAFRKAAIEAGADVVIEDSITHAWQGDDGLLEMVNKVAAKSAKNDKYAAWRDPEVSDEKQKLIQLLRSTEAHVITTVRVKERFEYITDAEGKNKLQSIGEQQIQQADLKYEPDLVLHMIAPGTKGSAPIAEVVKSRYVILQAGMQYEFTPTLCKQLKAYLDEGVDPKILLDQQRQEYIDAIKVYLDQHPNQVAIYNVMKADAGLKNTKLADFSLEDARRIYTQLSN